MLPWQSMLDARDSQSFVQAAANIGEGFIQYLLITDLISQQKNKPGVQILISSRLHHVPPPVYKLRGSVIIYVQ